MHYRPEIDGLRAIAVVAVILFHAHWGFPGGFFGVDVFFVISGYLISSLVARDLDRGEFRLARFWERRVRRILPASAVMVVITIVAGALLLLPGAFMELGETVAAHALMSANVYFWRHLNYFGGETRPLLHMWSLAVEEQFYLFFPLVLSMVWRRGRSRVVGWLLALTIASFTLSIIGTQVARASSFYLLPARAWELLIGAILAIGAPSRVIPACSSRCRLLASSGALVAMVLVFVEFSESIPVPGWIAVVPCAAAATFIWSEGQGTTAVGRILGWWPFRWVGQLSYSLYLWHWPLMAFARACLHGSPSTREMAGVIVMAFGLSILSWTFIEEPFRRRFRAAGPRGVLSAGVVTSLSLLVLGGAIVAGRGVPQRFPGSVLRIGIPSTPSAREEQALPGDFDDRSSLPSVGASGVGVPRMPVVLWGDSHGAVVSPVLHRIGIQRGVQIPVAVTYGTAPILGAWYPRQDWRTERRMEDVVRAIGREKATDVIWISRWSVQVADLIGGISVSGSRRSGVEVFCDSVRRTIDRLKDSGVERIWICLEVPCQVLTPAQVALRMHYLGADPDAFGISRADHATHQKEVLEAFSGFERMQGVTFVDLADPCFDESGLARIEGPDGPFYRDDDHLSDVGAETHLRRLVESILEKSGERTP